MKTEKPVNCTQKARGVTMTDKPISLQAFEAMVNDLSIVGPDFWTQLLEAKEDLVPELNEAIVGDLIRHPLLVSIAGAKLNSLHNFQLLDRKHQIDRFKENGDWSGYVSRQERPYRIDAFQSVMDEMDDELYWHVLSEVYSDSESTRVYLEELSRLLTSDRPNREAMMSDEEKQILEGLPEKVTIFRGYRFSNARGWSWTLSKAKAEWFANRFADSLTGIPRVATGKLKKQDVIAYLDGREEQEIICDPKFVKDISTVRLDDQKDEQ